MGKLLGFQGLTGGGWIGWAIGARHSLALAFLLSVVASGLGLYIGRRIAREYF